MKAQPDAVRSLVLDSAVPESAPSLNGPTHEVVLGTLAGFAADGTPLVTCQAEPDVAAAEARSCVHLNASHVGAEVVLLFEGGDLRRPIVVGVILRSVVRPSGSTVASGGQTHTAIDVEIDGRAIVIRGEESVMLRCGEASITLTREGKVVVKGTHLVSHSRGVNRIRGGSVELN